MDDRLDSYRDALERVAVSSRTALADLGIIIDAVVVRVGTSEPGHEAVRTDYIDTIEITISDTAQFAPPPEGANLIYGVCHEVGHLAIASVVRGHRLPPVVWDEAVAHYLALDVFLPAVAAAHGDDLWPTPYPDYLVREVAAATGRGDHAAGHDSYPALLERQTDELRSLAAAAGGPAAVLDAVASVAATDPRPEDWRWKLRGRLLR